MSGETATLDPALPDRLEVRAAAALRQLADRGLRLATAESCTGGMLAALLTDLPGVSHVFERGMITYTADAKHEMLGVPRDLLDEHGAVSRPVALAMARGAVQASPADLAVAITGFADEPDEKAGEECAGLVHLAIAWRDGAAAHSVARLGRIGRGAVRIATLDLAISLIEQALNEKATMFRA